MTNTIQHNTIQYNTIQICNAIEYAMQYNRIQQNRTQYNTIILFIQGYPFSLVQADIFDISVYENLIRINKTNCNKNPE